MDRQNTSSGVDELPRAPGAPVQGRDVWLDVIRNVSLLGAVTYHLVWMVDFWNASERSIDPRGLSDYGWAWILYWVLWILPSFFFVAGAVSLRPGTSRPYRQFVLARVWRVGLPVLGLIAALVVMNPILYALDATTCKADPFPIGVDCVPLGVLGPLWFLGFYLFFVLLTPLFGRIWKMRLGWVLLPATLAFAVAADISSVTAGTTELLLALAGVASWAVPWMLGFAYSSGQLARIKRPTLVTVALCGIAFHWIMVAFAVYQVDVVDYETVSQMAVGGITWIAVAMLARWPIERWARVTRPGRWVVGPLGNRLVTLYIWHIPVVAVVIGSLIALGAPLEEDATWLWLLQKPFVIALTLALLIPIVMLAGKLEDVAAPAWLLGRSKRTPAPAPAQPDPQQVASPVVDA